MKPEKDSLPLGETKGDVAARTLGTLAGTIPGIGQMIQIALTETIPNARLERIETYLRHLSKRTDKIELENALKTPEGLDLFEEGIWQAARALSEERKQRIAELVANGLKGEAPDQVQSRHFLRLLNQLDDEEIALLVWYWKHSPQFSKLDDKDVFAPLGDPTPEELDAANFKLLRCNHLTSFGLLDKYMDGDEFQSTPAGVMFLKFLGIAPKNPPKLGMVPHRSTV